MSFTRTKPKNYISLPAASGTVRRLFSTKPDADDLSLEEVYLAAGRQDFPESTNRNWLNNKMNQLKFHNLIAPVQTFDKESRRHKLTGIRLTMAGKKAIGRIDESVNSIDEPSENARTSPMSSASLNDVARAVEEFQRSNPSFDVVFDVKFKGVKQEK